MPIRFSDQPGARERHLQRRQNNPLFPAARQTISETELAEARLLDQREQEQFMNELQALVEQAVNLPPNADSEDILKLKEQADIQYGRTGGLCGDMRPAQAALKKLIDVIMAAVRRGAGTDAMALTNLDMEEQARAEHFRLQAYPLIADLMAEHSVIEADELLPSLLTESTDTLQAALPLFQDAQLAVMLQQGNALLEQLDAQGSPHPDARARLQLIEAQCRAAGGSGNAN